MESNMLKTEKISFSYKKFLLPFTLDFGDCQLKNNKIIFKNSSSTISESDLRFVGETTDLIAYILNKKDKIAISGDLKSTYTNLKQLMTLGDISEDENSTTFPNWVQANINTEIENFSYDNFTATNLKGNIQYNNGTLKGFNMSGNSLDGDISGYFIFTEPKNKHLMLLGDINFTKINIRNSFHAFNNYGQTFIKENEIKGIGTAEMNIEAHWKPNFILDEGQRSEYLDFSRLIRKPQVAAPTKQITIIYNNYTKTFIDGFETQNYSWSPELIKQFNEFLKFEIVEIGAHPYGKQREPFHILLDFFPTPLDFSLDKLKILFL